MTEVSDLLFKPKYEEIAAKSLSSKKWQITVKVNETDKPIIKYNIKRALLEGVFSQTEKKGREESLKQRLIILISTFNTTNLKN